MWLKRRSGASFNLTTITLVILSLSLVIKLVATIWLKHYLSVHSRDPNKHTYQGSDYPETWTLPTPRRRVRLGFENTNRYQLDTAQGAKEWAELVPGGDGVVYLGAEKRPFGVSLFHQMRCLDVLREEVIRPRHKNGTENGAVATGLELETTTGTVTPQQPEGDDGLVRHCLNYLKQMILCRGDVHLESFNYASHIDPIDQSGDWECRDWEGAYEEARKNQRGTT